MKPKLRKITITLDEEIARWARVEAAREDTSISRLVCDFLRQRMEEDDRYEEAMKSALARKPFGKSDREYFGREEAHGRTRPRV